MARLLSRSSPGSHTTFAIRAILFDLTLRRHPHRHQRQSTYTHATIALGGANVPNVKQDTRVAHYGSGE